MIDSRYLLPKEERGSLVCGNQHTVSVVPAQDVQPQTPQALLLEVAWPLLLYSLLKDEQMLVIDHYILYSHYCILTTLSTCSGGELIA